MLVVQLFNKFSLKIIIRDTSKISRMNFCADSGAAFVFFSNTSGFQNISNLNVACLIIFRE